MTKIGIELELCGEKDRNPSELTSRAVESWLLCGCLVMRGVVVGRGGRILMEVVLVVVVMLILQSWRDLVWRSCVTHVATAVPVPLHSRPFVWMNISVIIMHVYTPFLARLYFFYMFLVFRYQYHKNQFIFLAKISLYIDMRQLFPYTNLLSSVSRTLHTCGIVLSYPLDSAELLLLITLTIF